MLDHVGPFLNTPYPSIALVPPNQVQLKASSQGMLQSGGYLRLLLANRVAQRCLAFVLVALDSELSVPAAAMQSSRDLSSIPPMMLGRRS